MELGVATSTSLGAERWHGVQVRPALRGENLNERAWACLVVDVDLMLCKQIENAYMLCVLCVRGQCFVTAIASNVKPVKSQLHGHRITSRMHQ